MFKNLKTGFSLIEVMILFAVLAVIMAASIPILTRKTISPPKLVSHGVYICIADGVDAQGHTVLRQEFYNATTPLGSSEVTDRCTFNVPNAGEYKVELYSAGAGGVQYLDITSTQDNNQEIIFNRESLRALIENGITMRNLIGENISHIPTNDEFRTLFGGMDLTLVTSTANGGNGGSASLSYQPAKFGICRGQLGQPSAQMMIYANANANDNVAVNEDIIKQYNDYCRNTFSQSYSGIAGYYDDRTAADLSGSQTITQDGGVGGNAARIGLRFRIMAGEGDNAFFRRQNETYPFLAYMSDLINNSFGHGYSPAACSGSIQEIPNGANCTSNVYPTDGESGNSVQAGENASEINGDRHIWKGEDGESPNLYAAFRIPPFANNSPVYNAINGSFRTIQQSRPQGGKGGEVYRVIQGNSNGDSYSYNTLNPQFSFIKQYGDSVSRNPEAAANGDNAQIGNPVAIGQFYSIFGGNGVPENDLLPSARLQSTLFTKHYQVGNSGTNGRHETFRTKSLGRQCTMTVPNGGPVMPFENYGDNNWQTHEEELLGVNIVCRDGDNIIFNHNLPGGRYDTTLTQDHYTWQRADDDDEIAPFRVEAKPADGMAYANPIWSMVFNRINLRSSRVAQGGNGTSLEDRCTVPRGNFIMQALLGEEIVQGRRVTENHNGLVGNYQCYPELRGRRTYTDIQNDNIHYNLTEPTAGGPGAVIITW